MVTLSPSRVSIVIEFEVVAVTVPPTRSPGTVTLAAASALSPVDSPWTRTVVAVRDVGRACRRPARSGRSCRPSVVIVQTDPSRVVTLNPVAVSSLTSPRDVRDHDGDRRDRVRPIVERVWARRTWSPTASSLASIS